MNELTLNGQKHPIKFGMREVTAFSKAVRSTDANQATIDADALIASTLAALKKGYRKSDTPMPDYINEDWLEDQIDDDPAAIEKISKAVNQSKYGQYFTDTEEQKN